MRRLAAGLLLAVVVAAGVRECVRETPEQARERIVREELKQIHDFVKKHETPRSPSKPRLEWQQ